MLRRLRSDLLFCNSDNDGGPRDESNPSLYYKFSDVEFLLKGYQEKIWLKIFIKYSTFRAKSAKTVSAGNVDYNRSAHLHIIVIIFPIRYWSLAYLHDAI